MSVFANWMMDQEEEDELDPELSDIIGEKKRRKKGGRFEELSSCFSLAIGGDYRATCDIRQNS